MCVRKIGDRAFVMNKKETTIGPIGRILSARRTTVNLPKILMSKQSLVRHICSLGEESITSQFAVEMDSFVRHS